MRIDRAFEVPNEVQDYDEYATPAARKARRRLEKRPTLLWVDDSSTLLDLYQTVYQSLGFDVLATSSVEEAVSFLKRADVVVLDYDMPDMNGAALASLLKTIDDSKPIILHSGNASITPVAHPWVDAICFKGAPREELLAVISRLCEDRAIEELEIFQAAMPPTNRSETQLELLQLPCPDFANGSND